MRTELLNKEKIEAQHVEWWEVRVGIDNETKEPAVLMYFKTVSGEEKTYVLFNDAPEKFSQALNDCIQGIQKEISLDKLEQKQWI